MWCRVFGEQYDVLQEPSAFVFRDKDSKASDPEDDSSRNPRNIGRKLPTQEYGVAYRNT